MSKLPCFQILFLLAFPIFFLCGCKDLWKHNKGFYLTVNGTVVDTNGVSISGADAEFPVGSQCCSRSEIVNGVCRFTTGADGMWSLNAQVCSEDTCSCTFTVKKSGLQDATQSFIYSGTGDSSVNVNTVMQP